MANVKYQNQNPRRIKFSGNSRKELIYKIIMFVIIFVVWELYATKRNNTLIMPKASAVIMQLISCFTDPDVIYNISLTMVRVLKGFIWAMLIGVSLGFVMGISKFMNRMMSGLIDSIRQIPIMAWVPLTIVWLGIGDGPTVFLIAMSGVFPVILNTIQGVENISKDYYFAAKSMGAGGLSIFKDIVVPGTLPDILTGARIAISAGWMSVI